jgi:hypothetical protein
MIVAAILIDLSLLCFLIFKIIKRRSYKKNQYIIEAVKKNSELTPIFKIIIKLNDISENRVLTSKEFYSLTICKNLVRSKIRNPVLRRNIYDLLEKKSNYFLRMVQK